MLKNSYPYYLANSPESPNSDLEVLNKYSGEIATRVALADEAAINYKPLSRKVKNIIPLCLSFPRSNLSVLLDRSRSAP